MGVEKEDVPNQTESGIKPGENYAVWKIENLTKEEFGALSPREQLNYLITCAHLAPSTHNTQPWAFKAHPESNSIEVYLDRGEYKIEKGQNIDKRRVLPASDVVGRQSCISIGCAIAHLSVTASHFDLNPNFTFEEINPEQVKPIKSPEDKSERYIKVGKFSLTKNTNLTEEIDTFDEIFKRRMNRGKYDPTKPIPQEVINAAQEFGARNKTAVHLITRKSLANRVILAGIAELQAQADNYVANNADFARELGHWFLPNDTDSYLGMPGDTFGIQDQQAMRFHKGLLGELNLGADEKSGLARNGKEGIESSFLVGMITVKEDSPKNWVLSGITFGKTTMLMEKNGIAVAVHAGLAEVKFVRRSLTAVIGSLETPVILFRAGYTNEEKPHSPRLPIKEITLS